MIRYQQAFRFATRFGGMALAVPVIMLTVGSSPALGQTHNAFGHEILNEAREVELALSAAPPAVARGAAVWALRRDGFEKVRESTNGFHCLIQRASNVAIIAPTCFDEEASRTIMRTQIFMAKLWSEGKSADEVNTAVANAYRGGELRPPARGSVGYMLSSAQFLGDGVGNWQPHMMIYAPYVTEADIGADLTDPKNPVRMLNPGRPDARIVVIVPDFVNPGEVNATRPTGQ